MENDNVVKETDAQIIARVKKEYKNSKYRWQGLTRRVNKKSLGKVSINSW